jgi:hypothetical protein
VPSMLSYSQTSDVHARPHATTAKRCTLADMTADRGRGTGGVGRLCKVAGEKSSTCTCAVGGGWRVEC